MSAAPHARSAPGSGAPVAALPPPAAPGAAVPPATTHDARSDSANRARHPGAVALSLWATQLEAAFLAAEAGSVLTLRMMSFSGLRPLEPGEHVRMVAEKPPAFLAAALAAWIATVSGQRADQVLAAAIRPLRAEASANVLRLSR